MHFIQKAEVEVRVQSLSKGLPEGVEVGHALCIVKGHQATFVVQVHSNPGKRLLQGQDSRRGCARHVPNTI